MRERIPGAEICFVRPARELDTWLLRLAADTLAHLVGYLRGVAKGMEAAP